MIIIAQVQGDVDLAGPFQPHVFCFSRSNYINFAHFRSSSSSMSSKRRKSAPNKIDGLEAPMSTSVEAATTSLGLSAEVLHYLHLRQTAEQFEQQHLQHQQLVEQQQQQQQQQSEEHQGEENDEGEEEAEVDRPEEEEVEANSTTSGVALPAALDDRLVQLESLCTQYKESLLRDQLEQLNSDRCSIMLAERRLAHIMEQLTQLRKKFVNKTCEVSVRLTGQKEREGERK